MGTLWVVIEYPTGKSIPKVFRLAAVAYLFLLSGCSLHYLQHDDQEVLDVELMRRVTPNHQPEAPS